MHHILYEETMKYCSFKLHKFIFKIYLLLDKYFILFLLFPKVYAQIINSNKRNTSYIYKLYLIII